ncbi:unnamed protein product [Polarella glacialis]|uniref:Uncharacterized protein n=1 Tax=Polarella glacialis TaxID=89957 RepID=A0A813J3E5_POLGL|nr:unnamed protein product [Polarella glacialis]
MGILHLHVGQTVKLATTLLPPHLVPYATGVVVGIEHHPSEAPVPERASCHSHGCVLLKFMPKEGQKTYLPESASLALGVSVGELAGVIAIKPTAAWQHAASKTIGSSAPSSSGRHFMIPLKCTQIPLAPAKVSTLHGLQGCTIKPGLLATWQFPKMLSEMASYIRHDVPRT